MVEQDAGTFNETTVFAAENVEEKFAEIFECIGFIILLCGFGVVFQQFF